MNKKKKITSIFCALAIACTFYGSGNCQQPLYKPPTVQPNDVNLKPITPGPGPMPTVQIQPTVQPVKPIAIPTVQPVAVLTVQPVAK